VSASANTRATSDPGALAVAGMAAFCALLFSAALVEPRLLGLVASVAPFPLIALRVRGSLPPALLAAVLAAAFVGVLFSPGHALGFLVVLAVPGLVLGDAMARGRGLVRACTWAFLLLAAQIGAALFFDGSNMANMVIRPIDYYTSAQSLEEMRSSGLPPDTVEQIARQFGIIRDALTVVYHSVFFQYPPQETRRRIRAAIERAGETSAAPLAWLRLEPEAALGGPPKSLRFLVDVVTWPGGVRRTLAETDGHARFVEVLPEA